MSADASPPNIPVVSTGEERPLAAAGVIMLAMFMLGILDSSVAVIARDTGLWQFHFIRSVLACLLILGLAKAGVVRITPRRHWAVALRGGLTGLSMLFYFGCLAFLPLGQVAAGLFTAPIWVMIISALFLGHPIGVTRLSAAVLGFAGVLMVLRPFETGLEPLAILPMVAGFFYALGALATRQFCAGESTFSMLLYFFLSLGVFGLLGTVGMTLWPHDVPAGAEGFILRGIGPIGGVSVLLTITQAVGSIIAVGLIFRGYQLGEAGQVAIYEYSLLIFAAGWSYVLFSEPTGLMPAIGMGLIILSGIVISVRSRNR
ncbi:DMT family transporter [Aliiroseovarius crassostreae]|uniref:DMT family transporter n=1 Tax=Aliiroseovarius crassostreae TaxID=154981 RepID=UPI0021FE8F17|nr:DMT family transporter [Aliiroseovarius crassostreae]UWP92950.1 DMT family transporter [Aliiroseovarius crassostreae]